MVAGTERPRPTSRCQREDQLEQQAEQSTIGDCTSDHLLQHILTQRRRRSYYLQHRLLASRAAPAMEDGGMSTQWRFAAPNPTLAAAGERSIQKALLQVHACLDERGPRPVIPLSRGDPSSAPSFRTAPEAEEALVAAVRSGEYNGYPTPATGLPARRAVAEYLSRDLPYMISHDDIFLTCGGSQAIETVMSVFGQVGVNILLPMPGYPKHEAHAVFHRMEVRHYGLLPERGWEVDLEAVEALADGNTVAIVITNPNNPCGSVYTYEHLAKIADIASKLGILVIADEVYGHLVYGNTPFVPMGVFGETVPVITLGAISKRWAVPGWRLGWIATCDPKGILRKTKVVDSLRSFISIISGPATFIQLLEVAIDILHGLCISSMYRRI